MFHKFRRESSRELNHDFFSSYIKQKHSSIYASVPNHITFVTYLSFLCFFWLHGEDDTIYMYWLVSLSSVSITVAMVQAF